MDRLRALAEADGFFTRQDAFGIGHDDRSIRRSLRSRLWVRVRPGAYTFPDLWPAADPVAQHLLTGRAVSRRFGPKVALSHTSGALAHGLLVWDTDLSQVHVTRLDGGAGRCEAGVVHHEGLTLPSDVAHLDGGAALHPARCAIETAALGSAEAGLVVLDSLLHLGRATRDELDATYSLLRTWPGMQATRVPVRMADGRAESAGESRTRYLCYAHGPPGTRAPVRRLRPRREARRHHGLRVAGARLLGEFDGRVKYERYLRPARPPATRSSARSAARTGSASCSGGG